MPVEIHSACYNEALVDSADLETWLLEALTSDVRDAGHNIVALLIDDAQILRLEDFKFLENVDNAITREGVNLVTIFMAQAPESAVMLDKLRNSDAYNLISRFLGYHCSFDGFTTVERFRSLLLAIDSEIWEDAPGVTWTEFFCGKAFGSEFRLADHAEQMFEVMSSCKIDRKIEFSSNEALSAVKKFLIDLSRADSSTKDFNAELWEVAVRSSTLF